MRHRPGQSVTERPARPARPARLRLAGKEPGARYQDLDTGQEHWGAALMREGIELPGGTGGDFVSALISLSRV